MAVMHRAVRVFDGVAFGVMLAVNGDPFLGHHAGREPNPHAEKMLDNRMQIKRAMRLRTMQINGDASNGHVTKCECSEQVAPPRQVNGTTSGEQ